ncbi:MAG: hypothetical protein HY736_07940 [Verrucomicrobia bacterium]|nr:hypothetical protein [Verrucomicrobiota bacterium]
MWHARTLQPCGGGDAERIALLVRAGTVRGLSFENPASHEAGYRIPPALLLVRDGYFSFVKSLSPPRRFTSIWFFVSSNSITTAPSI